jgi:N-acetylglucosaminyldiphosphoundecaprenol N-acetyl-beta-D-mannosaminyltransferase
MNNFQASSTDPFYSPHSALKVEVQRENPPLEDYLSDSSFQSQLREIIRGVIGSKPVEYLPSLNVYLLERRISCMTVPAIVKAIHQACIEEVKITVANYNIHSFNLSMQLPWFYDFLQSAEITNCDSVGILKAIRYMGLDLPIAYRASYTLLMPAVLQKCNEHGLSVFLLGSKPEILETALKKLSEQYQNVNFFGHHGYFEQKDRVQNLAVIEKINQVKPNILLVGMGMPIQENWVYQYRDNLQVNAIMLGGAIIDRFAGVVPDCPALFSNIGFEWLYRLFREPKRLAARYLLGNPAFALHIALGKFYSSSSHFDGISNRNRFLKVRGGKTDKKLKLEDSNQYLFHTLDSRIKRIVEYFVESKLLTEKQVNSALSESKVTGMLLGELLVKQENIGNQNFEEIASHLHKISLDSSI